MKKKLNSKTKKVVMVSGGFDPLHIGHVRMFREAKALGDELVVVINNDNWLLKKKGHVFMDQIERKEIIESIEGVDKVIFTSHKPKTIDVSVCAEIKKIKPHIFANGGDRKPDGDPVPEVLVCKELGIKMVYNIGHGGKVQSSSWLIKRAAKKAAEKTAELKKKLKAKSVKNGK